MSSKIIFIIVFLLLVIPIYSAEISPVTIVTTVEGEVTVFEYPARVIPEEIRIGTLIERINEYTAKVDISGKANLCYIPYEIRYEAGLVSGVSVLLKKNTRRVHGTVWDIISIGKKLVAGFDYVKGKIKSANPKELAELAKLADEIRERLNAAEEVVVTTAKGEVVNELLKEAVSAAIGEEAPVPVAGATTTVTINPPPTEGEAEEPFPDVTLVEPSPAEELTITTSSPLPNGGEGTAYSTTLSASGGTSPYTWSIVSGSLPSGLSLSSDGVISGTIAASGQQGTYTFTVRVTDSAGNTATKEFTLTVVYTVPTFSITQITDNLSNDANPQIYDRQITWAGHDGSDYEIYYWDGTSTTQITNNSGVDYSSQIYDGKITWYGHDGTDYEVYYWDGTSTTQITNNSRPDYYPQIYDGKIIWYGHDGTDLEIYYWDGSNTTNISNNTSNDWRPQIHDGRITWEGWDGSDWEIYYWDGSNTTNISNNTNDDSYPQIYDGKITWRVYDGSDYEIYYWDGSTTTQITNNSTNDSVPQIYDGKITWSGSEGGDSEIYYWDGSSITQITNNSDTDVNPQIYDGKITWNSISDIYYWDGTGTTQITNDSYIDYSPQIYDSKITWYNDDGNDNEIFFAERTAGSDPNITGRIYDSATGETIQGSITSIYPRDSTTALYNTTDNPYSFGVDNGYYYFRVEKEGYTFPSNMVNGITSGDHGENFYASGSSMTIDIPIDEGYPLEITKTANKRRVVNGDIITYDIKIKNNSMWAFSNINIIDEITNGFKYVKERAYIDNTQLSEGNIGIANREITFKLSNVPGYKVTHLTYQVRVGSGVSPGEYKTTAVAWDRVRDWRMSNETSCKVIVEYDALFTMGTIIGKVFNDENKNGMQDRGEKGIPGVLIATEYGVVVETDKDGKYHIPAVPPGNHLLKVDPSDLRLPIVDLRFTTENPYFVKITEGLLAKVNFGVVPLTPPSPQGGEGKGEGDKFFIVALGEGIVRNLDTSGNIEMVEKDDRFDSGVNVDGKLALYLKGKIKGKYLVTLSLDTERRPTRRGKSYEIRKLFTNLDPDKYYPVYGDASKIDYSANDTQDELYLLIEWDESYIKYGAFNTEIPLYNRTLQGLNIVYESIKKTKFGDPYTKINAFYARAYQIAAHDEFIGTGGSLYYLRHTPVIEGSEKIRVELRDQVSKEAQAVAILTEEKDYEIDYDTGRILLKKPLSSVNYNYTASIISNDILSGSRAYLIVDYEYESSSTIRRESYGIKVSQQIGNHIEVGGTYVEEEKADNYYRLMGGDSTIKINENTEITGEYNRSEETQLSGAYSIDGGLSYSTLNNTANDTKTGSAVSVKGKTKLFNNTDINLGYTRQDDNYSATNTISTSGSSIYTGSILTRLKQDLQIGVRHITQEVNDATLATDLIGNNKVYTTTGLIDYLPNKWDIRLEYQHQDTENPFIDFTYAGYRQLMDHDIIGGRIGYKLTPKLHPYIGGQGTVSGQTNNQGYIGLEYTIWENTNLKIKETVGNLGNSTLLGLTSQITPETLAYTNIEIGNNAQLGQNTKTTTGQRTQINADSSLHWERDYSSYQSNILQGELIGYDTKLTDTLSLGTSYERAQIEKEATAISRDSGSITLSYLNIDKLKVFSKVEVREDRGTETKRHWLTQNSILYQLTKDISLIGRGNWSQTQNRTQHSTDAQFHETGVGLAYRPVNFDRLNLLAKYSYITNDMPESQNDFSQAQQDIRNIYAIEGAYDLIKPLQLVGKFAMRDMAEKVGPRDWTDSETYLYIARLNFHITNKWDIAGEYRTLANEQIEDSKSGWLLEVDRELARYIRLGVGYNFTDYDDDLSNSDNYDAEGWFVRVDGKY